MESRDGNKVVFLITIFAIGGFFIILLNLILTMQLNDYESVALNEVKESVLYKYYSDKELVLKNVEKHNNEWTYTYEFNNVKETLENVEKYLYFITIEKGVVINVQFTEVTA